MMILQEISHNIDYEYSKTAGLLPQKKRLIRFVLHGRVCTYWDLRREATEILMLLCTNKVFEAGASDIIDENQVFVDQFVKIFDGGFENENSDLQPDIDPFVH